MLDKFVVPLRKILKLKNITISNSAFKIQTKITVIMLITFALAISSKQYFGEPIDCKTSNENQDKKFINAFCWIMGTYTDSRHYNGKSTFFSSSFFFK